MNRPGVPPGMYQQQATDKRTANAKATTPAAEQRFGPGAQAIPIIEPKSTSEPALADKEPTVEVQAAHEQPSIVESPLNDPNLRPKIVVNPVIETVERREGSGPPDLLAPPWPHLGPKGEKRNEAHEPIRLPSFDRPPPKAPLAAPIDVPPVEPSQPMQSGTSMKVVDPINSIAAVGPPANGDETTLVRAMKAFQANRPDEAVDLLKRLDPANQEVILFLMPLMVRLGEGNLSTMSPDELAMLIERLQTATGMLKSKASLRIDRALFCRGVRKFADVDPYEPRHEFRPGDMVFLYAELKNFTCEPVLHSGPPNSGAPRSKGFGIRLGASLELRDARNGLVWRTDLAKNDFAQTPPQDYYHTYRFCVPDKLPPGTYTLWLTVTDKPTNRSIRKSIEMRISQG
jgi:hypothetical protein